MVHLYHKDEFMRKSVCSKQCREGFQRSFVGIEADLKRREDALVLGAL
jgi:hypothetical protein